jgi:small neutral amino acid transporter SnatA (MarC family)
LKGIEVMGLLGAAIVTFGHWLSDLAYYTLVSFMVHRNERYINPHHKAISTILGFFMSLLGTYFVLQGIQQLLAY